jgi:hypothetical protein
MAYLYKHTRLDNDQVFYIGIGKDDTLKKRAYNKRRRSSLWKKIVSKINYRVDIIEENITWEEACKKEISLIRLYGKIVDGSGSLVNITSGGEGGDTTKNKICIYKGDSEKRIYEEEFTIYQKKGWERGFSDRHRKQSSIVKTGKKYSEETNKKKGRLGYKHKNSTLEKMSLASKGVKKPKVQCPHCKLFGAPSPMRRWHFDNCLNNKNNKGYDVPSTTV